jgi:hypothetical protein
VRRVEAIAHAEQVGSGVQEAPLAGPHVGRVLDVRAVGQVPRLLVLVEARHHLP